MIPEITHDGHHLFVTVPECSILALIDAMAAVVNYAREHGILLDLCGADTRDNQDGGLTIRYKIRSLD